MTTYVYGPDRPPIAESTEELRKRIPGWGADLDPSDRPSVPRERFDPGATGAHWDLPEQQREERPRERSIEHARLTPVFGTSCPTRGLSGAIRRLAYARYSEGRAAHWLLLMIGDRVDVRESMARSILSGRPDNPVTQTGILSEPRNGAVSSRLGRNRADVNHQWMDPIIVGGPWVASGLLGAAALRRVLRRR